MQVDTYLDVYRFRCRHCGHEWQETYDVRLVEDEAGGSWTYYSVGGRTVESPELSESCVACKRPTAVHQLVARRQAQAVGVDVESEDAPLPAPSAERSGEPSTSKIVVGIDGSSPSMRALRWAVAKADLLGACVEAALAWEPGFGFGFAPVTVSSLEQEVHQRAKDAVVAAVGRAAADAIRIELRQGRPGDVLVAAVRETDLLVVGSHGHGSVVGRLTGSVTEQCIRHAPCPVVVVPALRHERARRTPGRRSI